MPDEKHRGSHAPSPFDAPADPRVGELDSALRGVEAVIASIAPGLTHFRDPLRVAQANNNSLAESSQELTGVVLHPISGLGWYKVQVGREAGFIPCCALSYTGSAPVGVRDVGGIPPNSVVRVSRPHGQRHGLITGVVPPIEKDPDSAAPDCVYPGRGDGWAEEPAHSFPVDSMYGSGGVQDFSGQRPADSTSMEKGLMSATGVAVVVDDWAFQVRVSEQCGVFGSYIDQHLRVAGVNFDEVSAVHEVSARDDEGESRYSEGCATYTWEALGLYAPGTPFAAANDDGPPFASTDLVEQDARPLNRYQEYGGYLGQGRVRSVVAPSPGAEGVRKYGDRDVGLFNESIGLDGSLSVRSAKSVYIGKRLGIIAPAERKLPEDGGGDDAAAGGYKFASQFGDGPDHKVGDVRVEGGQAAKVSAVLDFVAHACGWKSTHPFHYHEKDFDTPQPSDNGPLGRVQAPTDFGSLGGGGWLPDPEPIRLRIDHRYGDVSYYERESFIYFLDDGGVILAGGGGEALVLAGGHAHLSAPGNVALCPGGTLVGLASQIVLRAKGSVDASSSGGDVRLKAEGNMQLLAGNGGRGAMLIESKSTGRDISGYGGGVGEDVESSGVIIRAPEGGLLGLYGGEIYQRSEGGGIVLDASKGLRDVTVKAKDFSLFASREANFYYGPTESTDAVSRAYHFGASQMVVDAPMLVGGRIVGFNGSGGKPGIYVDGDVLSSGSLIAAKGVSGGKGGPTGAAPDSLGQNLGTVFAAALSSAEAVRERGTDAHTATVSDGLYAPGMPGDDEALAAVGFSFRDDDSKDQYRTADLVWLESRWSQMARLAGSPAGSPWEERPVLNSGRETYPWPGRSRWMSEPVFLAAAEPTMFDPREGRDRDRPGPYESAEAAAPAPTTMAEGYRLID